MSLGEQLEGIHLLEDTGNRARLHKQSRRAVRTGLDNYLTEAQKEFVRDDTDRLHYCLGDYWRSISGIYYEEPRRIKFIDKLVGESQDLEHPVIVMDFGGGLGFEWVKLASGRYLNEVKSGKIIFVVTNLDLLPNALSNLNQIRKMTKDESSQLASDRWYEYMRNRDMVYFLRGDLNELRRAKVNGTPLFGNVGLLHDCIALRHCWVPEVELPLAGQFLRNGGTMMIEPQEIKNFKRGEIQGDEWKKYNKAWQVGLANLRVVGIEKDTPQSDWIYHVYRKKVN